MGRTRLGLIGCGGMAQAHRSRFGQLADRLQLTAAVDVVAGRAQGVASLFPGARAYTDYRQALDQVDAVLVALPHQLHHPVARGCLEAGKHVLLEKPMANSEVECLDLIRAQQESGRVLMVAYCMRYHPLVRRLKELLDQQTYGEVFQVSIWTEQLTRYPPEHWASSAASLGGGQLFSHGCHYIDLLLWYLGDPVRGVHLGTNRGTPWMEREGTSNVTLEFEGGRLGYHFGTWGARGTRLRYSFHAHCTEGMLEADVSGGRLLLHSGRTRERAGESLAAGPAGGELLLEAEAGKHTGNEMVHFLDCVEGGRTPLTDGPGSLQGLRVIWALYRAEREGNLADLRGLGLGTA
ncbi:MAG: Gfo/Idh/MocA family oxidoreductase [Candidatus Latescibacterota bacterium]